MSSGNPKISSRFCFKVLSLSCIWRACFVSSVLQLCSSSVFEVLCDSLNKNVDLVENKHTQKKVNPVKELSRFPHGAGKSRLLYPYVNVQYVMNWVVIELLFPMQWYGPVSPAVYLEA